MDNGQDLFEFLKDTPDVPANPRVPASNLREFLEQHQDEDGLPVFTPSQWKELEAEYPVSRKDEFYAAIGDHLTRKNVPFPRPLKTKDVPGIFRRLCNASWHQFLQPPEQAAGTEYVARQPYRNWTSDKVLGVVGLGSQFNVVSDHFQWENRLRCRGWNSKSPLEIWDDPVARSSVNWIFYSFPEDRVRLGMTRDDYVGTFRLRTYTATQFRPQVAKAFFDWYKADTVLDISCGWGDRLAGFYASSSKKYFGCDPNRAVWEVYQRQCAAYDAWLADILRAHDPDCALVTPKIERMKINGYDAFRATGQKEVVIVNGPAEDIDWAQEGLIDLVFASPPYFAVEKYAEDQGVLATKTQSWSRYPKFENWRDSFLLPVAEKVMGALRPGGAIALNMADPTIRGRHEACDPLVEHLVARGMVYEGVVAMAMKKRPSTTKGRGAVAMKYAEPVWVLRKPGREFPSIQPDLLPTPVEENNDETVFTLFSEAQDGESR